MPDRTAEDMAAWFAGGKARSVSDVDPEALVLGSDTLIELNGEVVGKPANLYEARATLRRMAGREHLVHTAVTLSCRARSIEMTHLSTAQVLMKPYDAEVHERYLATGDCLGKAGAYSIQGPGGDLIAQVRGDFLTVVGFPLRLVATLLEQAGSPVPVNVDHLYQTKPYANWDRFSG